MLWRKNKKPFSEKEKGNGRQPKGVQQGKSPFQKEGAAVSSRTRWPGHPEELSL